MEIRNPRLAQMATGNLEEDQFLLRFSKYLYTAIHYTANTYWKKVRLKESIELPIEDIPLLHKQKGIESTTLHGDVLFFCDQTLERLLLLDALRSLTEKQRDVLEQYFFAELSAKEIADKDGIALVTVYDRLSRAVEALRKYMDKENP